VPLQTLIALIEASPPMRVPGTAVFMTAQPTGTPPALAHNLRHNKVLHEHVIVLTVATVQVPHVAPKDRIEVESLGHGLYNMRLGYGSWRIRTSRKPSSRRASRGCRSMS
jgi:KUP system potassium uptake protein